MSERENAPSFFSQVQWPILVVVLLGGHTLLMLVALTLAMADPSSGVPANYYQDAMDWDEHRQQKRASDSLGWSLAITPSVMTNVKGERNVSFQLRDALGQPVDVATLQIRYFHPAQTARVYEKTLHAQAPGDFGSLLPMRKTGAWEFDVRATRRRDLFLDKTTVNVAEVPRRARLGGPGT